MDANIVKSKREKIIMNKNDDLIYRQDVINVLATMQGLCTSKTALIHNSKIWQQIKELPSAQRWTLVSEKPIPKGLVFVTYNDGDVDLLSQPTSYRRGDIVAWMPSPEPWKGDNNEHTN